MEAYFFNGWGNLLRVIVVGILAYAALVFSCEYRAIARFRR